MCWVIIIKQKFYSQLIAIEDSKNGIALMLPKATGLSISPLVGQNSFPHVTGGSGALAPKLRFDTPGPAYAGPDIIMVSVGQLTVHSVKYEINEFNIAPAMFDKFLLCRRRNMLMPLVCIPRCLNNLHLVVVFGLSRQL